MQRQPRRETRWLQMTDNKQEREKERVRRNCRGRLGSHPNLERLVARKVHRGVEPGQRDLSVPVHGHHAGTAGAAW